MTLIMQLVLFILGLLLFGLGLVLGLSISTTVGVLVMFGGLAQIVYSFGVSHE